LDLVPSEGPERRRGSPLFQWSVSSGDPFDARLYGGGSHYHLWIQDAGWIGVDPEARKISLPDRSDLVAAEHFLWSIPIPLCFLHDGRLALHAAAVEVAGSAILFIARGRLGKTTLAAGFCRAGHRVLSEDLTCVQVSGRPAVIPGPAMLRMRTDVFPHVRLSGAEVISASAERVSVALDSAKRGDCAPVPIQALVLLGHWTDRVRMTATRATQALPEVWRQAFVIPRKADRLRSFDQVVELLKTVPIWHLDRPPQIEKLAATVHRITAACHA